MEGQREVLRHHAEVIDRSYFHAQSQAMDIDECRHCYFHAGEKDDCILCACYGENESKPVIPGPLGMMEVQFCPLDIMNR